MRANLTMKKLTLAFLFIVLLAPVLYAQNHVTSTVQPGPAKAKEVLVIFEVEFKGINPKPIREAVLTDAITAELAEAGTYSLVDRDTQYYYFKQIQKKSHKPCEGAECLADLAANLDADLFLKAEVSKAGKECRFFAKLYKRKPQTVLYFVDQTETENCACQAAGLEKAAHNLGEKLTGRDVEVSDKPEIGKEINPSGTKGGPMVIIPAGEFMMGCNSAVDSECGDDEKPYHRVYLDAYYIGKYEVTVANYEKCVNAGQCNEPSATSAQGLCNWGSSERGNHPVNCVDWNQSKTYCEWAGKRLPTEAEWEKAARGTDGRVYPYGNQFDCGKSCNSVKPCRHRSTCPVGSYPEDKSPYGVMDMVGNVSEWVQDWDGKDYYKNSPTKNPPGPSSGDRRVTRGGNWMEYDQYLFTTFEHLFSSTPTTRGYREGFRCVRDAK